MNGSGLPLISYCWFEIRVSNVLWRVPANTYHKQGTQNFILALTYSSIPPYKTKKLYIYHLYILGLYTYYNYKNKINTRPVSIYRKVIVLFSSHRELWPFRNSQIWLSSNIVSESMQLRKSPAVISPELSYIEEHSGNSNAKVCTPRIT